jgi:predicted transcriptional regulator
MRQETIQYFTEHQEALANRLMKLGTKKNVATVLVFLSNTPETTSREIERGTDMRQPEISMAMKYLIEQGWVLSRDTPSEKMGRPTKLYALAKSLPEIMDQLGKERPSDTKSKLVFIRKLRDYHDKTLRMLSVILVLSGIAVLIWTAGISLPATPVMTQQGPLEQSGLLAAPVSISPGFASAPGQQIPTLTPLLQWSAVEGADSYIVDIDKYPFGPDDNVYTTKRVYGTFVTIPGSLLVPNGTYRWTVSAVSGTLTCTNSTPLYFTTPAAEPVSSLAFFRRG